MSLLWKSGIKTYLKEHEINEVESKSRFVKPKEIIPWLH